MKPKHPASGGGREEPTFARFPVYLFGEDLQRMKDLRAYLVRLGVHDANRSLLVKLALRGVEFSPSLKKHIEAIQAEDGRRTRHHRKSQR